MSPQPGTEIVRSLPSASLAPLDTSFKDPAERRCPSTDIWAGRPPSAETVQFGKPDVQQPSQKITARSHVLTVIKLPHPRGPTVLTL